MVTRKKNIFGEYNYYFIFTNNNKKNERMMILEIIPEFKTQFCDTQRSKLSHFKRFELSKI